MQIKFKTVRFKNLLSYGNTFTEMVLDQHRHTILTAKNGQGKSSTIESICYGLYGKPYRNIKLSQLINSINKKAMVVEIEFIKGADQFKVIRGQKPTIFEIYKNGELILEDAASRDYQTYLETEILGINFKTFKQIIVMGSASYTPFMNLSAAERRNITEEVLDIAVFSNMSDIAKQKVSEHKSQVESLAFEIQTLKNQIESQKQLIQTLQDEETAAGQEAQEKILFVTQRLQEINGSIIAIDAELESLSNVSSTNSALLESKSKLSIRLAKIEQKIESMNTMLEFYDADACPTCGQAFDESLKQEKTHQHSNSITEVIDQKKQTEDMLNSFILKINEISDSVIKYSKLTQERQNLTYSKHSEERALLGLQKPKTSGSIEISKNKLKEYVTFLVDKTEEKNNAQLKLSYYKTSVEILKDSGIKSKVILTFIPMLNTLINEYLRKFDMFVSFELDETFNETIKSRNRDTFSYNSFSEGEKTRIDLSILFAWRKIAMSRNSVSTNILIFDETLDRGLDEDSVNIFIDILNCLEEDVNSLVISHRNLVPEMFDRHMTVEKIRDFSVLSA